MSAQSQDHEQAGSPAGVARTLRAVATIALLTHALSVGATQLWIYPDSVDYIILAGGIADRFDLANELFLVRPPGYPLMLAGVFVLFGTASPIALMILQHAMAVATVTLTAAIAWRLTALRIITLLTGLLAALSLQTLAYANLVLTETPFALTLVACVYFLIAFVQSGRWRWLAFASAMAGVAYLFRPIGLHLLGACALAVVLNAWQCSAASEVGRLALFHWRSLTRLGIGAFVAVSPALLVALPWVLENARQHDSLQGARCLDYVLYLRAVEFDQLDAADSAAMNEIHAVVEEAIARGDLEPDASFRDRATVIAAFEKVRGQPFAVSSGVMGQAGRDIMMENKASIVLNTLRYSYWMLLSPDPVYRFVPGGAPGVNGQKDVEAEFFDIGTYAFGAGSWNDVLNDHRHHLPLTTEPRPATTVMTTIATTYHDWIDDAPAPLGLFDSPYEQWMIFCGLSGLLTLLTRQRNEWLIVAAVIAMHVLASAFLGGPQTRYVLPVRTLLMMYAAFGLCVLVAAIARVVTRERTDTASTALDRA